MNFTTMIVRVVSIPEQCFFGRDISLLKMQVEFLKYKKNKGIPYRFEAYMWGFLGPLFLKYYAKGDIIIIQGIFSFHKRSSGSPYQKDPRLTVTDFYPFLVAEEEEKSEWKEEEGKVSKTSQGQAGTASLKKNLVVENQKSIESTPWLSTEKVFKTKEKTRKDPKESLQSTNAAKPSKKEELPPSLKQATKKTKLVDAEKQIKEENVVKKTKASQAQSLPQKKKSLKAKIQVNTKASIEKKKEKKSR